MQVLTSCSLRLSCSEARTPLQRALESRSWPFASSPRAVVSICLHNNREVKGQMAALSPCIPHILVCIPRTTHVHSHSLCVCVEQYSGAIVQLETIVRSSVVKITSPLRKRGAGQVSV